MIYCIVVSFLLFFTCLFSAVGTAQQKRIDGFEFAAIVWKFVMSMLALSVAIVLIVKASH